MVENIFGKDHFHITSWHDGVGALIHAGNEAGFKVRNKIIDIRPISPILGSVSYQLAPERHFEWLEKHAPELLKFACISADELPRAEQCMQGKLSLIKLIDSPKTYWYSSRNISEYSSFLAFVCTQQPDETFNFVDVAQAGFIATEGCPPEGIYEAFKHTFKLDASMLRKFQEQFDAINREDTQSLHLFREGRVKQAPFNFFDETILKYIGTNWRRLGFAVQNIYTEQRHKKRREFTYDFLLWRLSVLQASGKIERRGESAKPHNPLQGEVRLC